MRELRHISHWLVFHIGLDRNVKLTFVISIPVSDFLRKYDSVNLWVINPTKANSMAAPISSPNEAVVVERPATPLKVDFEISLFFWIRSLSLLLKIWASESDIFKYEFQYTLGLSFSLCCGWVLMKSYGSMTSFFSWFVGHFFWSTPIFVGNCHATASTVATITCWASR